MTLKNQLLTDETANLNSSPSIFSHFNVMSQSSSGGITYVCSPCGYDCDKIEHSSPGQCSSCGMPYVDKTSIQFANIDFVEMCKRISSNKSVVLIDVRSAGEFTGENEEVISFGHFEGAININVNELPMRLSELKGKENEEIIIYCSHSHRSPRASYFLTTHGFKNVANVEGGVSIFRERFASNSCLSNIFVPHE